MVIINLTIDLQDGISPEPILFSIRAMLSQLTNNHTEININQVDDPLSLSPISGGKIGDSE